MPYQKKDKEAQPIETMPLPPVSPIETEWGLKAEEETSEEKHLSKEASISDEELFGHFPRYQPDMQEENNELCCVLFGYGVDAPTQVKYVDDYKFVGGVCRNVPRNVASAWKKGKRWQDNKPARSRVYLQAILPNDATPVDFAKATGVRPMEPAQLAAMIGATDAQALVQALGRKQAAALIDELKKQIAQ